MRSTWVSVWATGTTRSRLLSWMVGLPDMSYDIGLMRAYRLVTARSFGVAPISPLRCILYTHRVTYPR